jgi:putative hemolysin
VRIVANDLLGAIAPLQDLLLPVRILGGKAQRGSLHAVEEALAAEQCVIVFPAGEVSRLSLRGIRDGRWQRGFVRFARAAARRCCRCGWRRATRRCSTAPRPCSSRPAPRCWRARCSPVVAARCG